MTDALESIGEFDIAIVGAGPAGSACAIRLARAGLSVALVDKAFFPRDKPCGEYQSPEIQRIFESLGVKDKILAANPAKLKGMRIWTRDGNSFQGDFSSDPASPIYGLSLPRLILDNILMNHAKEQGASVFEGFTIKQLINDGKRTTGIEGHLDGQKVRLNAKLIVGADGINSVVAQRLGIRQHHRWLRKVAFVAHFDGIADLSSYGEMFVSKNRYCGIAPLSRDLTNVCVVVDSSLAQTWKTDIEEHYFTEIARYPLLANRIRNATMTKPIKAVGPLAVGAKRATASGAILVGDAAFFLDPFTGEGMYTALANAELASDLLLKHWESDGPTERFFPIYEKERLRAFRAKWRVCSLIQLAIRYPAILQFFTERLGKRKKLADILVGVTGDFRSPYEVLSATWFARLLI